MLNYEYLYILTCWLYLYRLDDLAMALISTQESQVALDTSVKVDLKNIERKMDDAVNIATAHVGAVQVISISAHRLIAIIICSALCASAGIHIVTTY